MSSLNEWLVASNSRNRVEHRAAVASSTGGREVFARVRLDRGDNVPPVHIDCQDGSNCVGGFLSLEAAEILRRALNDVLGPIQEKRQEIDKRDHEMALARASRPSDFRR